MPISVGQRLAVLVVVCALMIAVVGGFAWVQLARVSTLAIGLGQNALPGVQQALEARLHVAEYRAAELRVLSEPNNRPAVLAVLAQKRRMVEQSRPVLEALVVTPEETAAIHAFGMTWKAYLANSDNAVDLAEKRQWDDAWTLLTGESQRQQEAMHGALSELSRLKARAADDGLASVVDARQRALLVLWACAVVGLVLAVTLAVLLSRSITRPLQQALDVAVAVAEGDLSHSVAADGPREIGALLRRLQQMQTSLRGLVGSVRESADGIRSTSESVANGNRDLSARTEDQESNVKDVVATMGELSAAVQSNTAAAREVGAMVVDASDVARRGGVAVQRVVATMSEINQASKRIATIVDLTKDIAFQTDILAINASVEAARAAGQGRAFAVVASEVRALAKRSSAAAREIATLIASSVEKVNAGAVEVHEAGRTMDEIVAQVERVSEHMRRIADSTVAQSGGIAAVDGALAALDELTRQNATLVDHNRAASDALQGQSEELGRMVAVFRLGVARQDGAS